MSVRGWLVGLTVLMLAPSLSARGRAVPVDEEEDNVRPPVPWETSLTAFLAVDVPSAHGWKVLSLKAPPGPPRIHPGDRLRIQVFTNTDAWVYVLVQHSLYAWTLLWSYPPVSGAMHGVPRGPGPDGWIADDRIPGASRLIFVASRVPLPALESLTTSRNCPRPARDRTGRPTAGPGFGGGDDPVCYTIHHVASMLPPERSGLDEDGQPYPEPVWVLEEGGREYPALFGPATSSGIAATALPIRGVR